MLVAGKTYVSHSGTESLEIQGVVDVPASNPPQQKFLVHLNTPDTPKGYYIYGETHGPVAGRDSLFLQGGGYRRKVPQPAPTDEFVVVNMVGHVDRRNANDVPTSLFLQFTRLVDGAGHQEELRAPDGEMFHLKS